VCRVCRVCRVRSAPRAMSARSRPLMSTIERKGRSGLLQEGRVWGGGGAARTHTHTHTWPLVCLEDVPGGRLLCSKFCTRALTFENFCQATPSQFCVCFGL
jgi:hypothetical protein